MAKDLSALFCPKSVAVIGASRNTQKVGSIVLKNLINSGFTGQIYPINPNTETLENITCYKDIYNLPDTPDLAIIALPAAQIIESITHIGERGIKNVLIFAAGFKESGSEGEALEKQLIEVANRYQINLLGPNCLGFANNNCPINATFGELVKESGNLRFITQSGAIATSIFDWCRSTSLGFSHFVTLGNKAVLNENDLLEYFQNLPANTAVTEGLSAVQPVGLYLESISDGTKFLQITSQVSKTNPIFILKPGKSQAAAKAMQSHTGAIAGEDQVLQAAFNQAGVIRCETLEDFFDYSRAFAWENAPQGPKVAIISNAGGPAVISADAVVSQGLELAEFDDQTKTKLSKILPRSASILNPVDVLGDALADRFTQAAEIILQTDMVHALVVILTPQIMTQIDQTAEAIGNLAKKYQKPIFCSFIGGQMVAPGEQILNRYKIPSFRFPERAIATIGAMHRWRVQKARQDNTATSPAFDFQPDTEKIKEIIGNALNGNQKTLDNLQANDLVSCAGIPTPPTQTVADLESAKSFAQSSGWPVVLKLSSPGLLHKKEIGGVLTDLSNDEQLETAWNKLQYKITQLEPEIRNHVSVQIQKDILGDVETIVGVKKDPTFGPVMLFGAGGSLAELIADRNLHLLPVDISQAQSLVDRSKIGTILKGHSGQPPYALEKLYDLMVRLAKLSETVPDATDIEINPVIVTQNDAWAVDAKVILKEGIAKPAAGPQFKVATTVEHTILATTFHYFVFETETPLTFQAGQYVSVKVAGNRINCYSVAGHEGPNRFHLLVNVAPGGPGSKFFENLKVGDKISYLGPFGTFTLKLDGAQNLLFMGTGSGLAPLICMADHLLKEQNSQVPITVYLGLTAPEDVFWLDRFEKMKQEHPNFKYRVVVWKANENWHGDTGFITQWVENDFPDASSCSAYLCGNKNMITDVTNALQNHGCPKERIYTEKF